MKIKVKGVKMKKRRKSLRKTGSRRAKTWMAKSLRPALAFS
jgi:hypothetical protein